MKVIVASLLAIFNLVCMVGTEGNKSLAYLVIGHVWLAAALISHREKPSVPKSGSDHA